LDRLSDHRFVANDFQLDLHVVVMNLGVRLRRFIARGVKNARTAAAEEPAS
jgi:hypothetical protein